MLHVLVADTKVARIFIQDMDEALHEVATLRNSEAFAHERDFVSDRPGRVRNPAAGTNVAYQPKRSARGAARERWAKSIAEHVRAVSASRSDEGIVLVAAPRLMASIHDALPALARKKVRAELARDLAKQPIAVLQTRLHPMLAEAARHSRPHRAVPLRAGR